ncbi:MAG TPA: RidA family protein [Candidatus Limnocylindrales bacterium]|nr:RidA family protein [Candidatus Limnocylindrales bacterium]
MEIENRLKALGIELPKVPTPAANYIGYVRVGNLLFIGGNIGRINGAIKYRGKVGAEVTLEQAYDAARNCALNHLAIMKAALGDLDRVERIVKVLGYVNVAPGFIDMPKVVNGESDLLVQLFGESGRHTRAAIGVASLSNDAPVENEVTVQVKD